MKNTESRTLNYKHGTSKRTEELWPWIMALDCWDYGKPEPLAELILNHSIPEEFEQSVREIVTGERKKKQQAIKNLSTCPKLLNDTISELSLQLGKIDFQRQPIVIDPKYGIVEDIQAVRVRIKIERDQVYEHAKQVLNLSKASVDNHLTRLRKTIKYWNSI